ncbi:hypothetical protein ACP4OV_022168 [Aristida adscensionis]
MYFLDLQNGAYDELRVDLKITDDQKRFFKDYICSYYKTLVKHLDSECESLNIIEKINPAIYEKRLKFLVHLSRIISNFSQAIDMDAPPICPGAVVTQRTVNVESNNTLDDIPVDVIIEEIYSYLPARIVFQLSQISRHRRRAYLMASVSSTFGQLQETRGGRISQGLLLATDVLQQRVATKLGVVGRYRGRRLREVFPGRKAQIVASERGLRCVFLRHPEELLIWNPIIGQTRSITSPLSFDEMDYIGMAVSSVHGQQLKY